MGMISAYFQIESVFIAVGITSFVCLGVTLFSFQTKYDFTSWIGVIFAVSLALMGFGIVCAFTYSKVKLDEKEKEKQNRIFRLDFIHRLRWSRCRCFFNCKSKNDDVERKKNESFRLVFGR